MKKVIKIEELANAIQNSLQRCSARQKKTKTNVDFQVIDFKISVPLYLEDLNNGLCFSIINTNDLIQKGKYKEVELQQLTRLEFAFKPILNAVENDEKASKS